MISIQGNNLKSERSNQDTLDLGTHTDGEREDTKQHDYDSLKLSNFEKDRKLHIVDLQQASIHLPFKTDDHCKKICVFNCK